MTIDPAQQSLVDMLQSRAGSSKGITFINGRDDYQSVSYAQMFERAMRRLAQFQQAGLETGQYVIIQSADNAHFLEGFWACLLGGLVAVPVATGSSSDQRQKLFRIAELLEDPALCTDAANLQRIQQFARENELGAAFDALQARVVLLETEGLVTEGNGRVTASVAQPALDDTAFVQFSSGSTSAPKGIVLTHRNLMSNLASIIEGYQMTPEDHQMSWMPLTHDMGLIGFHLTPLATDANQSLIPTDLFVRRPGIWLSETQRQQASVLCSPNFGYQHLLKSFKPENYATLDLSSVRLVFNGAEPISASLCEQFIQTLQPFGLREDAMFPVYGLAEASLAVAFPALDKRFCTVSVDRSSLSLGNKVTLVNNSQGAVRFVSVGRALQGVGLSIRDEAGAACEERITGRICIRGDNVTSGYLKQPELNAQMIDAQGWLDTGDLGFMHDEQLYITGRAKDIIFINGQNVYPHDLEEILLEHGLAERGKLAVSSLVPSSQSSEQVLATKKVLATEQVLIFILHRGDIAELEPLFADMTRVLSKEAGVRIDALVAVPRLPKTTSGKIQRYQLLSDYQAGEFKALHQPLDSAMAEEVDSVAKQAMDNTPPVLNAAQARSKVSALLAICNSHMEGMQLAPEDNLFELGISSLTLAEIHASIEDTWPDQVDITDLFDYPTVAELAAFLDTKT